MKKELLLLVELQKIDDQFHALEISKGTLPQELERLDREEAELRIGRENMQKQLKELEVEIRHREKRHDELKVKVDALQEKLFSTQTNQEYEAVTREIDWHQDALNENETAMVNCLEQQEELQESFDGSHQRCSELVDALDKMKARFKEHSAATAVQVKDLENNRDQMVSQIPKPLLAHYERIRKAKDGRGVVSVYRGTSCGGCFQTIPPQKINQVRRMQDLILCEICGRILISDQLETGAEQLKQQ